MSLTPGTRVGPYEILAPLGAGGMGEVYRARDTTLHRDVALKILPVAVASDPDRRARFRREAQILASLNHPNIAQIHGVEESSDVPALVMELVPGRTLAEVIASGPRGGGPPSPSLRGGPAPRNQDLTDTLTIAKQIAEALEAAHDAGIIHRDLKPANIKLRDDGVVKVLDFGLAKAFGAEPSGAAAGDLANSPTMSSPALTEHGLILGTAAYMAPEQARGRPADRRADIWAFGAVLYELLCRRPAFAGETVTDLLAAVISRDVDWTALPPETPPHVRRLLVRCLDRDPRTRLRDIGEARVALSETAPVEPAGLPAPIAAPAGRLWPIAAGGVVVAAAAALLGWGMADRAPSAAATPAWRLQIDPRPAGGFVGRMSARAFSFTPDGDAIVFASTDGTGRRLYLRRLDRQDAVPIAGTEGGSSPFLSPDGAWLGFQANGALKKVPIGGGTAQTVHELRATASGDGVAMSWGNELGGVESLAFGSAWLPDDTIVYGRFTGGLWRIPAAGGAPVALTSPDADRGETSHRLPSLLPGGRAILFTANRELFGGQGAIDALVLATGARHRLVENGSDGRYSDTGHVLFARDGVVHGVRFDPATLQVEGEPFRVLPDVMHAAYGSAPGAATGVAQFDVSPAGALAFIEGGILPDRLAHLTWVSRGGRRTSIPGESMTYYAPTLSPDGRFVLVSGERRDQVTLFTIDLERDTATPVSADAMFAVWSADGQSAIAAIPRRGRGEGALQEIWTIPIADPTKRTRVATSAHLLWPASVSADGRWFAYVESNPTTGNDIWLAGLNPEVAPRPLLQTPADENHPAISPDGRWLAYTSRDGGGSELFVRPLVGPGRAERVSTGGSGGPVVWTRDGRSLLYLAPGFETIMAAEVTLGDGLRIGRPQVFAEGRIATTTPVGGLDVSADGRVLALVADPTVAALFSSPSSLQIIVNARDLLPNDAR